MKALKLNLIALFLAFFAQDLKADCFGPGQQRHFNRTVHQVAVQYYEQQKVAIILDYVRYECFTTQQLGTFLNQLRRDDNRLRIAKDAYFFVSDPYNYNQLVFHMRSHFARRDLRDFIARQTHRPGNMHRGDAYRPPQPRGRHPNRGRGQYYPPAPRRGAGRPVHRIVADHQVNQMIFTLQNEPFNSTRIRLAETMINGQNALFTTAQIARIVRTLTFDSGKLEVAKIGYHRVADPGNFYQITNELTFSSNKRALLDYISR